MAKKPTYEELEQRVKDLAKETAALKRSDEALKESEERLRHYKTRLEALIRHSELAILTLDAEHNIISCNEYFEKLFQFEESEIIGKNLDAVIAREEYMEEAVSYTKDTIEGKPIHGSAKRYRKDGTLIDVGFFGVPVIIDDKVVETYGIYLDIGERKRAEEALLESKERYRAIFDQAADSILLVDGETGAIVEFNERAHKNLGYTREEFAKIKISDFEVFEPEQVVAKHIRKIIKEGSDSFETKHRTKGGEIRDIHVSSRAISLLEKDFIQSISRDITDRKRAEEKILHQSKVLDGINKVFQETLSCESDEEVAIMCLSVAEELTGSKFGFIGEENKDGHFDTIALSDPGWKTCKMPQSDVVVMIENMEIRGIWGRVLKGAQSIIVNDPSSHPDRVGTPEGHPTINSFMGVPLKHEGRTIGMVGLANKESGYDMADQQAIENLSLAFVDALERKRSEKALQDEREQFLSIFGSINQIIYISDPKTHEILYANDTLKEKFKKDLIGGICYREFQGLESPCEFCTNEIILKEKYKPYLWEYHNPTLNRAFMITDRIIKWPDGRDVRFEIAIDITERKHAEDNLKQANKKLLSAHNQRKILSKRLIDLLEKDRHQIAMELHDHIGQTLTSLKMNLEMINGQLKPSHTELGAQITAAQERIIKAIKDVKNVSHGLWPATIDALGIGPSLRELCNEIQQQTDMEVHFFSQGIPERFEERKELAIYRIAQEALNNIIRHAQAKTIFVNLVEKDEKLSLSVEDDGVGFDQDRVMKPSKRKGALGLLIMRERAVQLDGEFTIESQPGKGTHLLVEIPL